MEANHPTWVRIPDSLTCTHVPMTWIEPRTSIRHWHERKKLGRTVKGWFFLQSYVRSVILDEIITISPAKNAILHKKKKLNLIAFQWQAIERPMTSSSTNCRCNHVVTRYLGDVIEFSSMIKGRGWSNYFLLWIGIYMCIYYIYLYLLITKPTNFFVKKMIFLCYVF